MSLIVVGHRGVAGHFPENTKVSVQAAIDLGLDWVEIDVQPTKDNVLVVCHDHTINRCSNGKGRVDAYTLQQLQQFDFGSWFNQAFAGEPIMTLEELLILAAKHNLGLNIEVKVDQHDVSSVAQQLKQQLDHGPMEKENILLSSFSHDIMRTLALHCPGYKLGVLSERLSKKNWQLLEEINAFSCNLNFRWTSKKHVQKLQQAGYQVWCYTVNNPKKLHHLQTINAVFSDYPELFLDGH
ncbi:glycerophosphoryl diester phosphodiesterase [Vibrio aestuarianus]|uniref:glycerophosphodiester phosphodiesterase family protein n=1 Tax=Vibrio aestuarianus TaxID=28171 RepID=UPI0015595449|nr:glycerophosphodiester phosphodiesterase family protein [Vibrio aestuarianus]NGZ14658.1 glycerophosphoryl diester phosphodiesterase [Vibrio aestuarianus]NKZ50806.1 glycerophosphoryl diester phosphodiesterase [Vibrio aestuarianus]